MIAAAPRLQVPKPPPHLPRQYCLCGLERLIHVVGTSSPDQCRGNARTFKHPGKSQAGDRKASFSRECPQALDDTESAVGEVKILMSRPDGEPCAGGDSRTPLVLAGEEAGS